MNMSINKFLYAALHIINDSSLRRFINGMGSIKKFQQKKLIKLIKTLRTLPAHSKKLQNIKSYDDFKCLPITTYKDYKDAIDIQIRKNSEHLCKKVKYYQPTSGSTNQLKWIPYNKTLLKEFDNAASVWIADLMQQFPNIKTGKHYWSLSWLPNDLRDKVQIEDDKILSPVRRHIMNKLFAVPKEVSQAHSIEDCLFATVCFLAACENLSLISVWSPTFLLSILEVIENEKQNIIDVLQTGNWPVGLDIKAKAPKNKKQANKLINNLTPQNLWPMLSVISCWDTAQSKIYANKLKKIFPTTKFQGKGLWSTEAVITIPVSEQYLLSYQSHFYEFQDLKTNKIYPAWDLKKGMEVSPVVSTSNGLLRYKINDRLLVTGFKKSCPALIFLGRINDSDLVGEKLSNELIEQIFKEIKHICSPVTLIGVKRPMHEDRPYYLLLTDENSNDHSRIVESMLNNNHHYKLARQLKQLGPVVIFAKKNAKNIYENICIKKGMILGNIKVDSLIQVDSDEFRYE